MKFQCFPTKSFWENNDLVKYAILPDISVVYVSICKNIIVKNKIFSKYSNKIFICEYDIFSKVFIPKTLHFSKLYIPTDSHRDDEIY